MVLGVFNTSTWYLNAFNERSCNICSLTISVLTFIYTNNQQGINSTVSKHYIQVKSPVIIHYFSGLLQPELKLKA